MLNTLDWGHCALHDFNMTADITPMDNVNFCDNIQILSTSHPLNTLAHINRNGSIP